MALVEGFGDEVLVSLVLLALLTLAILAWMSTGVRDRPLISIIVVDGQNFQRILHRIGNISLRPISIHRHGTGNSHQVGAETPGGNAADSESAVAGSTASVNSATDSADGAHPNLVTASADPAVDSTSSDLPATEVTGDSRLSTESPEVASETVKRQDEPEHVDGSEPVASTSQATSSQATSSQASEATSSPDNLEAQADDEGQIRIRLKYLDDRQRLVHAKPEDTVGDFKRKHFGRELGENLMVRCIYNGQELRQDSNTLQAYNVEDNSVIHCLLSSRPAHASPRPPRGLLPEDWDLGFLMFPLFGIILALTWYFRVTYRTYFNAMSTFSLLGITFLYFIALLASLYNHDEEDVVD